MPSSYQWGQVFDYTARAAGNSRPFSAADQLLMCQAVSAYAYSAVLWPFSLVTTDTGSIPCVNGQQDYPAPENCYRLARAWLNVPTVTLPASPLIDNSPQTDPSAAAAVSAALSAAYVGTLGLAGGTPAAITWPRDGSLNVVKRLPVNLTFAPYTAIRAITQAVNSSLRLDAATAVSDTQPYSLELEYQPKLKPVNALTEELWMPDAYLAIAEEGLRWRIYRDTNDSRAGTVSMANGEPVYSGQLATWMQAIESSAVDERAGSVDAITPTSSLGAGGGNGYNGLWGW